MLSRVVDNMPRTDIVPQVVDMLSSTLTTFPTYFKIIVYSPTKLTKAKK